MVNLKCFGIGLTKAYCEAFTCFTAPKHLAKAGSIERGKSMSTKPTHAERVALRRAINGQPNGYRPITEAELQAAKLRLDIEALEGSEARRRALRNAA